MIPLAFTEHTISSKMVLTIIDIDDITDPIKEVLDKNFVLICEGNSGSDLATVKTHVKNLFSTKQPDWIMGATVEFLFICIFD